ncbi:metallophosphoesterase [Oscillatoria laete-virens NRMC-F 0139]|nr:metallophosphoesterase [Oscillatoria laete-virens]MDL5052447.1 metallophosphoesterase [Oscillatoria laete-virens NRMC-F 0139]
MSLSFRFAIISDLHIALPQTIWDHPSRFHLVEVSIPALEQALTHLGELDLDFLLLPGDLTQHGEPENHAWLQQRLAKLPYPVYVVPGNHDVPVLEACDRAIGFAEFPHYYRKYGYRDPSQLYYSCEVLPGVRLIGLNSNQFDDRGKQLGYLDRPQLAWLETVLAQIKDEIVLVMVHHNVIEHLPDQAKHPLGQRYMLANAPVLLDLLHQAGVKLIFTGHLHVQDIATSQNLYEITTGSLVSYPHPYRILQFHQDDRGHQELHIESHRIEGVPQWPQLGQTSREWMGDRSKPFMLRLLTHSPAQLTPEAAEEYVESLRYFWADIAQGDSLFEFPHFPPSLQAYFRRFGAVDDWGKPRFIDNHATLIL